MSQEARPPFAEADWDRSVALARRALLLWARWRPEDRRPWAALDVALRLHAGETVDDLLAVAEAAQEAWAAAYLAGQTQSGPTLKALGVALMPVFAAEKAALAVLALLDQDWLWAGRIASWSIADGRMAYGENWDQAQA